MIDRRIAEWLASRDTGLSAQAIVRWLGAGVGGGWAPGDTSDVGRCIRLLDRIPEWRPRMSEMAGAGGAWPAFARHWAELEAALIADSCGGIRATAYGWGEGRDFSRSDAIMNRIEGECSGG